MNTARLEFLAQSLVLRQRSCPHCRSTNLDIVARKYVVIRIVRCRGCLLYFTSPIYKSRIYSDFYDDGYDAEREVPFVTGLPTPERLEQFKRGEMRPGDRDFRGQLAAFANMCREKTLLELGSSWGYLLYQAKVLGFDAAGIEIARRRREFGIKHLGVSIHASFAELAGRQFDIVFSYHVLEHFTDISTVFGEIRDHLKPGGRFILEVPNFDYEQFGPAALPGIGAVHPLGFSSAFFQRNLSNCGLDLVGIYSYWSEFPAAPTSKSTSGSLIVHAQKGGVDRDPSRAWR